MSYLTIYAHHNFKSIELDNKNITKLDILKKLKIFLFKKIEFLIN
jgi:hypothetical protein